MAPSNDEERRVQGYLQVQGAKLSPAELVAKVRVAMDELRITAAAVTAARFYDPPAPGEWSANEVLAHVADAGALFAERVRRALDGEPQASEAERREGPPPRRLPAEWLSRCVDGDVLGNNLQIVSCGKYCSVHCKCEESDQERYKRFHFLFLRFYCIFRGIPFAHG